MKCPFCAEKLKRDVQYLVGAKGIELSLVVLKCIKCGYEEKLK